VEVTNKHRKISMATIASPNNNNHSSVPPAAMPLISPSAFLHAHLVRDPPARPSKRLPSQCRPITLNTSSLTHANGSALVRIGDTAVVCGVRAEILPVSEIANYRVKQTQSAPKSAFEGDGEEDYTEITNNNLLVPNIELATGCSPNHLPGSPPSSEAQSLSQRLLALLHTSRLVPVSELHICYDPPPEIEVDSGEQGGRELKAYWTLYIDILVISYGGGIFDAAWFALYAALRDTIIPRAWWDVDLQSVVCSPETSEASHLRLRGCPVPLSFGVFVPDKMTGGSGQAKSWILCDTDTFEDDCCTEKGTVTVDEASMGSWNLVKIEKRGGGRAGRAELKELVEWAGTRWREWDRVLQDAMKH
jgi:exosome complex component RRP43